MNIPIYTKESLIAKLLEIKSMGWIENSRHGNHGGVGNTIEDLLGIREHNLPIPNAAEWELKCQRLNTVSTYDPFSYGALPYSFKICSLYAITQIWLVSSRGREKISYSRKEL